ncbi:tandem-95 repeat protein, partial [Shewanella psychromarinicola]|uniref:tandem-95 repeat protein n=1 Tax=Shewanella psychromarinicola TaxID=2487742 RepID=UPI00200BFC23
SDLSVVSFEVDGQTYSAGTEVTLDDGVLVLNADGSYTFTPNENWNGQVPVITYTTNTGETATLTIQVTPVNDASVLVNDSNSVAEDTAATGNVLDNDSDVDSDLSVVSFEVDGQTYSAGTEVTLDDGVLVLNADGSYTFTPNENWNGQVPVITYTINTGVTATLTIEVTPVDDASVLVNDSNSVAEDTAATGNVLDNDSDVDSDLSVVSFEVDGQTYSAGTEVTLDDGVLVLNADGSYTFTPNENWNGQVPVITYTTNTGETATLTIQVTPTNDAPTIDVVANDFTENSAVDGDVAATYTTFDEDGDLLTVDFTPGSNDDGYYALVNGEVVLTQAGADFVNNGGTLPAVDLTVSDGSLTGQDSDTPVITPTNDAPTIDVVANDFTENSAVDGDVAATYTTFDEDGDLLTVDFTPGSNDDGYYALVNGEVVLTQAGADFVNNGGTLPAIDLTVSDGSLTGQDSDTPVITPTNDAPTIDVVANDFTENSAVDGDVAATYTTFDEDGDLLTVDFTPGSNDDGYYALVNGEVVLTQAGADFVNNGGTLPAIDLTVSDGSLTGQDSDTPVITPTNDAPTIDVVANDFTENSAVDGDVAATYNTFDEDGDSLTVDFTPGTNDDGYYALVNGEVVLTPAGAELVNSGGTLPPVDLTVSDGSLTGQDSDTPAITAMNDDFTDANETRSITEDSPEVTGNVIDGTSDDGPISVTTFTVAGDATVHTADGTDVVIAGVGTFSLTDAGVYTFTPVANYNGTVPVITYTLTDGSGANDTSTLSLTVTPVNDDFTDNNETRTIAEDSPQVTGNVIDGTSVDGPISVTTYTVAGDATVHTADGTDVVIAGVGTFSLTDTGVYTFTPVANYNGPVPVITYVLTDGSGANDTSTLSLTVTPVNDDFTDNNETRTIAEDSPQVTGNVIDGTSVDGPISVTTFTVAGDATVHTADGTDVVIAGVGTFSLTDTGVYTFTPVANYNGPVPVITYVLTDGSGPTDTSTLTITVSPVNDNFTDANEVISVAEDSGATTGTVLTGTSSVDGPVTVHSFSIDGVTGPLTLGQAVIIAGVGSFTLSANGAYSFTPVANYNGP